MKVVFSRKGWDSSAGGWPSPILPDGELLSLPIPFRAGTPLDGLSHPQCGALATLAADLSHGQRGAAQLYHFDPDLRADWAPRQAAWRPAFGQDSAAQRHLSNQGVTRGDVFLFFGWFRKVEQRGGTWAYVRGAPDVHVLFGWLQIGDIVRVDKQGALSGPHPWLATHPHVQFAAAMGFENTIYVAERQAAIDGRSLSRPGGGLFRHWHPDLQLTRDGRTRSVWKLPGWCMRGGPLAKTLTYHHAPWRWTTLADGAQLRAASIGQEFVLDLADHGPAIRWLEALLLDHG